MEFVFSKINYKYKKDGFKKTKEKITLTVDTSNSFHYFSLVDYLNYTIFISFLLLLLIKYNDAYHSVSLISLNNTSRLCQDVHCLQGVCENGKCICDKGWQGKLCHSCGGRIKLTQSKGYISDGKKNYSPDLQCTWLIDASDYKVPTLIRLKFIEFETECNWDHLYVFSGDSIFSPLVAAFSGILMKRGQNLNELPELEIKSKHVYLYFYSDTAYNMTGFNLTYSIHSCKNDDCSELSLSKNQNSEENLKFSNSLITDHCSTQKVYSNNSNCNCNDGIDSLVCNMPVCPNKCSSHGECDFENKKCNCKPDFAGADCGQIRKESYWEALNKLKSQKILGRALHQSVVVDNKMWVIGGEFFQKNKANEQFLINYDIKNERWNFFEPQPNYSILKRFSHSLVHYNQSLYIFGGILENGRISNELWSYEILNDKWQLLETKINYSCSQFCSPLQATGHTATVVKDTMIVIFGYNPKYGYLNTVQEYNFTSKTWNLLKPEGALIKGGFGHSAVYHEETKTIYVFGGHHSYLTDSTLVDFLYAYLPEKMKWRILSPSKSPRYFHTASIINNQMYVYGGNAYNSTIDNSNLKCFSTQFLIYNIPCDTWNFLSEPSDLILNNLGTGRFGHTSVVHNNEMYIFGGYNGVMLNNIIKYIPANCTQLLTKNDCCKLIFNLNCVWDDEKSFCTEFNEEINTKINLAQSNTNFNIYKKNSVLGNIGLLENEKDTLCYHNFKVHNSDRINNTYQMTDFSKNKCPIKFSNYNEICKQQSTCSSCLENSFNCVWCDGACFHEKCKKNHKKLVTNSSKCNLDETSTLQFNCQKFHNCESCINDLNCSWHVSNMCFPKVGRNDNKTSKIFLHDTSFKPYCEPQCHLQTNCGNCTLNSCMWCSSLNRCIESNAYSAVFPLAQCMEWTIHPSKCLVLPCNIQGTCEQCQKNPRCGWCDDNTNTGTGFCMEGTSKSPLSITNDNLQYNFNSTNYNKQMTDVTNQIINSPFLNKNNINSLKKYTSVKPGLRLTQKNMCQPGKWYFTECPTCQCNGHSECGPNNSTCIKPCQNFTEGDHCEECISGYYGNPTNGGRCYRCNCIGDSVPCDKRSGRCFCNTKGVIGHYCEKCDEQNHYFGNPNISTCYYHLSIDFQYTFNMSKNDDRHFSKINFMNSPSRPDLDIDFTITCSNKAYFKVSFGSITGSSPTRVLHEHVECDQFKNRFSHRQISFASKDNSFFVNVHSFSYPFILQISFSQHKTLDLVQFFITFSSCFLTLLILAAILWKIKQKYDMYRRRQQFFMELEHLANRPFASIMLDIPDLTKNSSTSPLLNKSLTEETNLTLTNKSSKNKSLNSNQRSHFKNFLHTVSNLNLASGGDDKSNQENPTPIALEPCSNNKAAVLSLIVRLPTGGTGDIPIGQTGLAIASALVSLGSVEQKMTKDSELVRKNHTNLMKNISPAFV